MSYELDEGESLHKNLQRICRKQIEAAIAAARGERDEECSPVHATRKHLKRARAALQLARKAIGSGAYCEQRRLLREAGRLISDVRDAEMRLQTVRELETLAHGRGKGSGSIETMLQFELENFMAAFGGWQKQVIPLLENARDAVDDWTVKKFGEKQFAAAVKSSYKRSRNALAEVRADPTPEKFHELRSHVKRLCFQLQLLEPINAVVLNNLIKELSTVGKLLGRAHDLSFVSQRLRDHDADAQWKREAGRLLPVAQIGEEQLQERAEHLGEHFFGERPRDFGKRLGEWLQDWERNDSALVDELT